MKFVRLRLFSCSKLADFEWKTENFDRNFVFVRVSLAFVSTLITGNINSSVQDPEDL
jgi:hypothetical protein